MIPLQDPEDTEEQEYCPNCNVSLRGGLVADTVGEEAAKYYSGKYWSRKIGIEDPTVYDGVIRWKCPDCKHEWPMEGFEHVRRED